MKIEKTWTTSSEPEKIVRGDELVDLAARWDVEIEVHITHLSQYRQGPVEREIIGKEWYDRRKDITLPNTAYSPLLAPKELLANGC